MRGYWAAALVVSLPLMVRAQTGPVLGDSPPPDQPAAVAPAPDDTVTAAPLPAPDQPDPDDARQEMVPNPLEDPNAAPAPGDTRPAAPRGQAEQPP